MRYQEATVPMKWDPNILVILLMKRNPETQSRSVVKISWFLDGGDFFKKHPWWSPRMFFFESNQQWFPQSLPENDKSCEFYPTENQTKVNIRWFTFPLGVFFWACVFSGVCTSLLVTFAGRVLQASIVGFNHCEPRAGWVLGCPHQWKLGSVVIGSPDDFIPLYMGELSLKKKPLHFVCFCLALITCLCNLFMVVAPWPMNT